MRLVGYYVINVGFVIYGALRLLGAVPAFAHIVGWWENDIGREVVGKLDTALPELSETAIVVLPLEVYMGWSAVMGVVLTLGAAFALFRARIGYILMGIYYALFGLLFVNYPTVNIKILHLIIGLSLFFVMLLLARRKPG